MFSRNRAYSRNTAFAKANSRKIREFERPRRPDGTPVPVSEYFGCNTFGWDLMQQSISAADVAHLREVSPSKRKLTRELADRVAEAVKNWALAKGATHYCHWFQPQTGATAEKHDAFFSLGKDGKAVESFVGKLLMQQEPDASSFPSGGRRSTFEARGYTAWDATSPMFLMETVNGLTLCIPSVFISYSGESLDKKTPLLRSITAISDAATESLKLLGDKNAKHVVATCGPEQEYFIIDRALYEMRPDLVLTGRTLMGRVPPKGQQLDDHYFGSIKSRVLNFMMESEYELFKLGVPCKTRHNEVAPAQYEAAPIFEFANIAADHNQLVMEVLKTVAKRHDLVALFHEKPYADMNGSGKHLNWSLADQKGNNLLDPSDNPEENVRFLYFLTAAVKSVYDWGNILRASVASAGNDYRLGANEAPPAIMSVFLGETLTNVLDQLGDPSPFKGVETEINLDLPRVPVIAKDNTDRNRTSPFAFTGNKFEFRALGSSQSVSYPTTFLNCAVTDSLKKMNQMLLEKAPDGNPSKDQITEVIKETYESVKTICFEGDGYSEEWHQNALTRGLKEAKDTPSALEAIRDEKTKKLMVGLGIYDSADELESRYNVLIERYNKIRMIELETSLEMVMHHVLPAAHAQLQQRSETADSLKEALGSYSSVQKKELEKLCKLTDELIAKKEKLSILIEKCRNQEDQVKLGHDLALEGVASLEQIGHIANQIELNIDDDLWSLPRYREMIFSL